MTTPHIRDLFLRCRDALRPIQPPVLHTTYPPPAHASPPSNEYFHAARVWARRNCPLAPQHFADRFYRWMLDEQFRDTSIGADYFELDPETLFLTVLLTVGPEASKSTVYDLLKQYLTREHCEDIPYLHPQVTSILRVKCQQYRVWVSDRELDRDPNPNDPNDPDYNLKGYS